MPDEVPLAKEYLPRWITAALREAVTRRSVVLLTGPKQVGKSTLLVMTAPFRDWRYITLDDFDTLRLAKESPQALWTGVDHVVIDEVQKVPELVKFAVEGPATFLLAGSMNLDSFMSTPDLREKVTHFSLRPLALGEINHSAAPSLLTDLLQGAWPQVGERAALVRDPLEPLLHGLLPALVFEPLPSAYRNWWRAYISEYLERDLGHLAHIANLPGFRRLMAALALRTGRALNQSALARDAQLPQPTAHRYINLLARSKMLEFLPSRAPREGEILVRSPRIFWHDPALPVFLAGYFDRPALEGAREVAFFFRNLVLHHLRVLADLLQPRARVTRWQTRNNQEVDFILEQDGKILALQVSFAKEPTPHAIRNLGFFLDQYPHALGGILFYRGETVRDLGAKRLALPWEFITG